MLNDRQIRFCEEYLANGYNATQAAISAGYSEDSARNIGYENMTKPDIVEYIENRQKEIYARLQINQDRIARELGRIGFSDIRKFYTVDGSLKSIHDLDDDAAAVLAGVETLEEKVSDPDADENVTVGWTKKIKLWDKHKALETLGRHLGMFGKDNEQKKTAVVINGMEIK